MEVLQVKISSPSGVIFDSEASSISGKNGTGDFDVLVQHRNFITLLLPCTLRVVRPNGEDFNHEITSGMLHVQDNSVDVFLDI